MTTLDYTPHGKTAFTCRLESPYGHVLTLRSDTESTAPVIDGDEPLVTNVALADMVWAYGKNEYAFRRRKKKEVREAHRKTADSMSHAACALAPLIDRLSDESVEDRWCSGCFARSDHRKVQAGTTGVPVYLCTTCGAPSTPCAVPTCDNFANRRTGISGPRFCAEHRHDVPGFEKLDAKLASLTDYEQWLAYDKTNMTRVTKVAAGTLALAAVVTPLAFAAAPAIGGAIGAMTGLSGAAATSHGLALLGGGAVAAGGLGMAGGTAVVTALGAGLGGVLGGVTTSAYVSSDRSFGIVKLREGVGTPVILANGFLTQTTDGWGGWRKLVDERFPDSPIYRVHWGSKELRAIGAILGVGTSKQATLRAAKVIAKKSSKAAKIPGLGYLLLAGDIARNPWSVARTRAGMTGAVVADLIARTEVESFILVGHSLGARVMATATEALRTKGGECRVESLHLLGGAFGRQHTAYGLGDGVQERVWNYHNRKDPVLKYLYRAAEFGQEPAGLGGLAESHSNIVNVDTTAKVDGHSGYFRVRGLLR
jgi:hypothetical protein